MYEQQCNITLISFSLTDGIRMSYLLKPLFYLSSRYLAHNGEINTLQGNKNLMNAREGVMSSEVFGEKLKTLYPVVEEGMSDSGCVDNVLEFLMMAGGRSLPEVNRPIKIYIPEWTENLIIVLLYIQICWW